MDSLKTLMDKKQYDLVIKLTDNSQDSLSLFYRLSALLAVGQSEEALNLIYSKREIMKSRLALLIKFHIEILCLLGKFDDAYNELRYYQELPYESQEVEEILKAMPEYIRKEEARRFRPTNMSDEELYKRLLSKNDDDVLAALDQIKDMRIDKFILPILKIINSYPKQTIRAFALLLLVNEKYDKEVDYLHFNNIVKVVPNSLPEPFFIEGFKDLNDVSFALQNEFHDPSIVQNALQLLSSYLLYIYPEQIKMNKDEVIVVFGYLAKRLLQIQDDDLESSCLKYHLNYEKVKKSIAEIDERLKDF